MVPIDFILNFQVNASKAAGGIRKMQSGIEGLAQTFEEYNKGVTDWWAKSMPKALSEDVKVVKILGDELEGIFGGELAKNFSGHMEDVTERIESLYKSKQSKIFENTFDSLIAGIKATNPLIELSDMKFAGLYASLLNIRKNGVKGLENIGENLGKISETFDKMKPKQQKEITELFKKLSEDVSSENLLKINKQMDALIKKQEGIDQLKNAFSNLFGFLPDGINTLRQVAIAAGAYKVFDDAIEAQKQMVETITQLGMSGDGILKGMTATTMDFTDAVLTLGATTSSSMKESAQAMGSLANQRVTTNIDEMRELAKTSVGMSQAFGMSTDQATEFIKSLYKIGGLSQKEVAGAADAMANVQYQLGLTASEASGVATQVGSMTRTMKVFGGRVKDINAMTKGVAKLNVAFAKAGLSAEEANTMLTGMLDPDKLEENILLFQGLGMSASDAIGMMTGDTSKLANMDERMVQLAKNLKSQYGGNVFALKEMAKQYGMSLEQVQSLSQLTADDLKMKKEESDLQTQADKARASMAAQLQKVWNQLNVIMQAFALPVIELLTPVLGIITKIVGFISTLLMKWREMNGVIGLMGKIVTGLIGAGLLVWLLGIAGGLAKIIPGLGGIGKMLTGIKGGLKGIVQGAKDAIKSLFKLGKVGGKAGAAPAAPAAPTAGLMPAKKNAFIEQLRNIPAKQILAIGAAILMVAAGIFLIAFGFAQLAKAVKDLNPEQLNALLGMMGIIMGGVVLIMVAFIFAIMALGAAGTAAAPGLIAIGVAFLLIAVGVGIIVASIALLIHIVASSADGMAAFSVVVSQLAPMLVGMAVGIMAVGMAMILLGTYSAVALVGLGILAGMGIIMWAMIPVVSKLGEAFANMGSGIKNIAEFGVSAVQNLIALKDVMGSISGGFAEGFISQINAIAESMSKISTGSMLASATMKIIGTISPESSDTTASANTDRVALLISESNTYLSAIMENTGKIVSMLDKKEEPKREVYNRQINKELNMAK